MPPDPLHRLSITVEKPGPADIAKASFPVKYGTYSEIRTSDFEFRFNLNGEIKFIRGLNAHWPHPAEQLKRTDGNDWVYYSVGDNSGDNGVIAWMGEYYLPCLPYPSNPVWEIDYRTDSAVMTAFGAWSQLYADLYMGRKDWLHGRVRQLIGRILEHDDRVLHERSKRLQEIIGGRASVLPPDARHVDYEVVPLFIADGCRYHCRFCCVKTQQPYGTRTRTQIVDQLNGLRDFYGRNLPNYRALFLGNHDALGAGADVITAAVGDAHTVLGWDAPGGPRPRLYLFGSVTSLLTADPSLFDRLDRMPFTTSINIGFESVDPETLRQIGKPVDAAMVREAFEMMMRLNERLDHVAVTGNFVIGNDLPERHERDLADLLAGAPAPPSRQKGAIYLSPLKDSPKKRELLPRFFDLKKRSRLPLFMYLIQRL